MEAATRYADDLDANEDAVPRGLRVEEERVRTMVATSRRRLGTARTKGPPDTQKNAWPACRPEGRTGGPVSWAIRGGMLTFLTHGARDMQAGSVTYWERSDSRVEPDDFTKDGYGPCPACAGRLRAPFSWW